ncbi:hypothetical protein [Levilactobacillus suantsaiihabitans]|uniref:Cell surface protein n=1 Tax=Levilactobacillus suantsaiihabitans TaxID=2487722 RepID=A0A4Z0JBD9_9LACO|nr:hypothetical protein [Levilactobacillus suantsaiihabitans]TGD19735.1 hypothetical protein EGT51_02560 [Levilactobacillus suantsaiihabitans]
MKKLVMQLVLVLTLMIGVGAGTPALAKTVSGTGGTTRTSVYIVGNANLARLTAGNHADEGDGNVPSGDKPTTAGNDADQSVNNRQPAKKKSAPGAVVTMVKAGSADLIAGRLPQTSESRVFLMSVFGLLLLTVLMLSLIVYHQARLLKERE